MKLQAIPASQLLLQIEPTKSALKLQLGQILDAKIQTKLSQNLFELLLNNQIVKAKSEQLFTAGQRLKLVVEKADNPVILKSFTAPNKVIDDAVERQQLSATRSNLLRQVVPKEASFQPLAKTLTHLLQKSDAPTTFPGKLNEQLQKLSQSFATSEKIATNDGFKQAVKESGIFLEAKLAKNANTARPVETLFDLKAGLLKITALLNKQTEQSNLQTRQIQQNVNTKEPQTQRVVIEKPPIKSIQNHSNNKTDNAILKQGINPPPTKSAQPAIPTNQLPVSEVDILPDTKELIRQIEQSLNKIQLNQNNAVVVERNETPVWTMDIPIKNNKQIDILNVSIYKDSSHSRTDEQGMWSIQLKFNFEPLGYIHAKISLYDKEIMTSLWAEKKDTQQLIEAHLQELETQLEKTGLDIGCVQCLAGKPSEQKALVTNNSLVDLHL